MQLIVGTFINFFAAYSVHAWLQEDISGMFDKGFIRYWDEVYDKFEASLLITWCRKICK